MAALQPLKIRKGKIRFPFSSKEGNSTNNSEKDFDKPRTENSQVLKYSCTVFLKSLSKANIWTVWLNKTAICFLSLASVGKRRRLNLVLQLLSPLNPEQFAHCWSIIIPLHSRKCIWVVSGCDWVFAPTRFLSTGDLVLNEAGHCLPEVGGPHCGCFLLLRWCTS